MKEIKLSKLQETIYYDKCSNGLEVYMWVNEKTTNYYATLSIRYGSIDTSFKIKNKEYNVTNGVAHFLEHIKFNESDGKTANEYYDKRGTSTNAFTSFEITSYEVFGSNDILGDVNHLLDFVQNNYITDDIVEGERGIITEEVRMGKNNCGHKMYFETNKALYHKNKRKNEITGTEKDVSKITKEELNLVFDTFYVPSNMFLVITGNFNPYEMMAMVKENQSKKKFDDVKAKIITDKEDPSVVKEHLDLKGNIEIPKLSLCYKMPRRKFKDFSDIFLRSYISIIINANFGPTSALKEELLEKELIYTMSYSTNIDKDSVVINISVETKYPEEIISILKDNMERISITEDRLKRRIKCNIANLIAGLDDIEFVNSYLQNDLILYNKINNNIYDLYKSLDIESAKKIVKLFDLSNSSVIIMKPDK